MLSAIPWATVKGDITAALLAEHLIVQEEDHINDHND